MPSYTIKTKEFKTYRQARLSRDARFDGKFYVAVKTTGIYCRPICPAVTPKEDNIEYFQHGHLAAKAGYRPCLRCHPDSAPGSPLWNGVSTTLIRAKRLIDDGALEHGSLQKLSERLGITDRYCRQLFDKHLGISPKSYALYKQCEFAKKLLHQTNLPINEIALASGFNSIRRFNDCFKKQLLLTPTQVRKSQKTSSTIELKLSYRPPYDWQHLQGFFAARVIAELEWVDANSYGRTFKWCHQDVCCKGKFTAVHNKQKHRFDVKIESDNLTLLKPIVNNIRRILDLDTDIKTVESCLKSNGFNKLQQGLRLPGTWSVFEAGIRAILGQQISVVAARKLVIAVVNELGEKAEDGKMYFPTEKQMMRSDYDFIKMPGSRKETLKNLTRYFVENKQADEPDNWLSLKGIGPWTIDYAKMRGLSDPDIYLAGDLGVKKAMEKSGSKITPEDASPFRSYLTFQLWNLL
jgi:AraC family transcriptional regulator of adaptative response / DNA-3-methyladenine glycosylase II